MKCSNCNGKGYVGSNCYADVDECRSCDGKGVVEPMTNEEYIRSCSVEELAGAIYEWHSLGYARGKVGMNLDSVTSVVEWLKEIH